MPELARLSPAMCHALLSSAVMGRLAVVGAGGPEILPVNYSVVDEAIVMRVEPEGVIARKAAGSAVAFEVDQVDYETWTGWSVLAQGVAELVKEPRTAAHIREVWAPRPWPSGDRSAYLRIPWTSLSGRRVGGGNPMHSLTVRRYVGG